MQRLSDTSSVNSQEGVASGTTTEQDFSASTSSTATTAPYLSATNSGLQLTRGQVSATSQFKHDDELIVDFFYLVKSLTKLET